MSRFIESICCIDGEIQNVYLHQERIDKTFKHFYDQPPFQLHEIIREVPTVGRHKCRILYDNTGTEIEFESYKKRLIKSLKIVEGSHIDYSFKYESRDELHSLFKQRGSCDDIIIVKNGLCTDSYFSNLAFFDGKEWYTPKKPLLNGIRRQQLIQQGKIKEANISPNFIQTFKHISLVNAMLNLEEVIVSIDQVTM